MSSSAFKNIPLKCQTLAADGMFADAIQETTDSSAELKQLFLDCGLRYTTKSSPSVSSLVLTHLTQLKTLHLRSSCFDPNIPNVLASCLRKCPTSLQRLILEGADWTFTNDWTLWKSKYVETTLSQGVRQMLNSSLLKDLSLIQCSVRWTSPHGFSRCHVDVLSSHTSIQSLYITSAALSMKGQASFESFGMFTGHQLCNITLEGICCSVVDLSGFASLTSVCLSRLDTPEIPCKLVLPERVQGFSFCGTSLFVTGDNQCLLADLNCLTHLVLDPGMKGVDFMDEGVFVGQQLLHLPQLPGSLRHLHLKGNLNTASNSLCRDLSLHYMDTAPPQVYIDVCDWQCLTGCTNLERLTLPLGYKLSGRLYTWAQAARHVHNIRHADCDYVNIFGTPYLFN